MKNIALILWLVISISTSSPANAQTKQSIAYYPLNGNFNDATGNGHNAVETGLSYANDRKGAANSACNFNGNNAYSKTVPNPDLSFGTTDSFTVTFWMKVFSVSNYYLTMMSKCEISDTTGYTIGFDNSGKIRVLTNLLHPVTSSQAISLNDWQFIAVTYTNRLIKIYINGILNAAGSVPTLTKNNHGLIFGRMCYSVSNNSDYNGLLDEVKIFNVLLTDAEIGNIFSTGLKNNNQRETQLKIYPSLVTKDQKVKIESKDITNLAIDLCNAEGECIAEEIGVSEIETQNLMNGIYYLRVTYFKFGRAYIETSKFIVNR